MSDVYKCKSITLVPNVKEILHTSAADFKNAYYLAWIFVRKHLELNLENYRFICADLKLESSDLREGILNLGGNNYIAISLTFPCFHTLPQQWTCYFVIAPYNEPHVLNMSISSQMRLESLAAVTDLPRLRCAMLTDLQLPRQTQWPNEELLEVYFFQILKLSSEEKTYMTEIIQPSNQLNKSIDLTSVEELIVLLATLKTGTTMGFQRNSDIVIQHEASAQTDENLPAPETLSEKQPFRINPSEARSYLRAIENSTLDLNLMRTSLEDFFTKPAAPPEVGDSHKTTRTEPVVKLMLKSADSRRQNFEFECPIPSSVTFAATDKIEQLVKQTCEAIFGKEVQNSSPPIINCVGKKTSAFMRLLVAQIRARGVPITWLHHHLYIDKHQGSSQAYIRRAFRTANEMKSVILIMDADLFFPNSTDRKHLQYGRSAFLSALRQMAACGEWRGIVMTGATKTLADLASLTLQSS